MTIFIYFKVKKLLNWNLIIHTEMLAEHKHKRKERKKINKRI